MCDCDECQVLIILHLGIWRKAKESRGLTPSLKKTIIKNRIGCSLSRDGVDTHDFTSTWHIIHWGYSKLMI